MIDYLTKHKIAFDPKNAQSRALYTYQSEQLRDNILQMSLLPRCMGQDVLRLPIAHCELNPIELVWAQVKGFAAAQQRFHHVGYRKISKRRNRERHPTELEAMSTPRYPGSRGAL